MFCNSCGHENRNDRKFCENCGEKLRDYTKPRENLIMPEEIEAKQNFIKKRNVIAKSFNISLAIILVLGIALLIMTFLFKGAISYILSLISASVFVVFLCVWFAKSIVLRRFTKLQK